MSDGKVVFDIEGNLSGIHSALNAAMGSIAKQTAKWTVLGQTAMNGLVATGKMAFGAIKDFAKNSFEYNSQMQTYEVNFKTMLGSAEAAQHKMAELKQYAAKTPFAFGDLADATQTMLAFGLTSEESALALQHLGDISLGDANKLNSLTLAFSQVTSAGKLAGQDLLQMINAGFNPLKVIAEETGVAYADLKAVMSGEKTSEDFNLRMAAARKEVEELGVNASQSAIMLAQIGEDGMISADMVSAAMRIATSEGGAFYKALENASTTAQGQISTIVDSWDMLSGKMTGGIFDALSTNVLPKVITWLDELNAAFDENGFTGLKTAAERIFGEVGAMALDTGFGLIAQLYNGITGDNKSGEDIKAYLSGLWSGASESLSAFTDSAGNLLGSIWTSLTGQEATAANIINTVGGPFNAGITAANDLLSIGGTFMEDLAAVIGDDTLGIGGKLAGIFNAGKDALEDLLKSGADFGVNLYNAITGENISSEEYKKKIENIFSLQNGRDEYVETLTASQEAEASANDFNQHAGKYSASRYGDDWSYELYWYAKKAFEAGTQSGQERVINWDFRPASFTDADWTDFRLNLSAAMQESNFTIDNIEAWFEDPEDNLQSQLDNTHLTVQVTAVLTALQTGAIQGIQTVASKALAGLSGLGHASGGMFTSATRFLGEDGMHTFGESGPEVLLPLDALWRKMGLTFDHAFAANLDSLQYSVMPQIPAAAPAAVDQRDLSESIAASIREALSGITVELDKRKVGKIIAPEVSREISNDVNGRKWTA